LTILFTENFSNYGNLQAVILNENCRLQVADTVQYVFLHVDLMLLLIVYMILHVDLMLLLIVYMILRVDLMLLLIRFQDLPYFGKSSSIV
jgi:hypothetical protein